MIAIQNIKDIHLEQWQHLVDHSTTASFFQTKACYDFYASLSFLTPFLIAVSENGILKGVVCGYLIADGGRLKRFFSRRAIIPGGALLDNDISDEALSALLTALKTQLRKKAIYIELRNYTDFSSRKQIFEKNGFDYQAHLNFHLNITNLSDTFANLHKNKKRYIRLNQREGLVWELTKNKHDISELYVILLNLYHTKVKTSLFPIEFFMKLAETAFGKIIVVKYHNNIIGGGVFVELQNKICYEWFICGEDKKFDNVHPSIGSTWAGIEYAASNGFKLFDFMGAGKPDSEYGVRKFKSEFGGDLVEHGRFLCVSSPWLYSLGKKAIAIIKQK